MCLILRVVLALLLTVHPSLAEDETEIDFEGRWIKRPLYDTEFTFSVFINSSQSDEKTCTGSLIGDSLKWVLTAARCMCKGNDFVPANSVTIYAGLDKRLDDSVNVQERKSKRIEYSGGEKNCFSLALVELVEPFQNKTKNKDLQPLLFPLNYPSSGWRSEQICRSGSFGGLEWNVQENLELKKTMTVVQPCNCSQALQQAFPKAPVTQWMCGEYGYNIGLCRGDFGTALIRCEQNFMGIAIGIVSFSDMAQCVIKDKNSKECDKKTTISIYTDICHHLEWINKFIPSVPTNISSCDAPDSATSVRPNNSWHVVVYFTFVYVFIVSPVNEFSLDVSPLFSFWD